MSHESYSLTRFYGEVEIIKERISGTTMGKCNGMKSDLAPCNSELRSGCIKDVWRKLENLCHIVSISHESIVITHNTVHFPELTRYSERVGDGKVDRSNRNEVMLRRPNCRN